MTLRFRIVGPVFAGIILFGMGFFLLFAILLKAGLLIYFLTGVSTLIASGFLYRVGLVYDNMFVIRYPLLFFERTFLLPEIHEVKLVSQNRVRLVLFRFNKRILLLKFIGFTAPVLNYSELRDFFEAKGVKVKYLSE